jgi:hypothetical protein
MATITQSGGPQSVSNYDPGPLLHIVMESMALHQAVFAVAELGVADLLAERAKSAEELSSQLNVNENALYRILRLLASQSILAETSPRVFANTSISNCLRSDGAVSLRAMTRFRGTDFVYRSFGEILHTVRTGEPGRLKALGMDGWEYLQRNPEVARLFDDAMTSVASVASPAIAGAYDFSRWESIMDVGGGNGLLLSAMLHAYPKLRGVLADQEHVLERAKERGFLSGDTASRSSMQVCDLLRNIPSGCRAYLMKSVIHDWNDEDAALILRNCRKAVPQNGALLLVELALPEDNTPARGTFIDITMMVLTGGRERTTPEFRELLATAGFRLTKVVSTSSGFNVIEALPV